jgi:hypothetical protein
MGRKHLAEAIILQSIEDLWNEDHRGESIKFFSGEDFRTCARIAGIDISDQIKILGLLKDSLKSMNKPAKSKKKSAYRYVIPQAVTRELVRA